jgi:hypothetical protein
MRRPPSYQPPHDEHGPATHALSRSTSTGRTVPESAPTVWIHRVLKSSLTAKTRACVPASFQPRTVADCARRVVSPGGAIERNFTSPDGRLTYATRPDVCASPTLARDPMSSV